MAEIDESVLLGDTAEPHDEPLDENALLDDCRKEVKEELDLYDDAIATTDADAPAAKSPEPATTQTAPAQTNSISARPSASSEGRKYCCYVGNLLWYTTDADLLKALASTGLARSQFADMKFFENRTNGQSKGYALLVLNSDSAVKQVMETLPTKPIHGQSPTVLGYNKANQAKLEDAMAKNQTRPDVKKKQTFTTEDGCLNMGTIRIGAGGQQTSRTGTSTTGRPNPPPLMLQPMSRPASLMSQPTPLISQQPQQPQMRLQINGQQVPMMNRAPIAPQQQGLMGSGPMGGIQQQPPQMMMGGQRPIIQSSMGMQPIMGMNLGAPPPMNNQFQNRPPQMGALGVQPLMQMNTSMRPPNNGMQPVHVNPQMFPGMQAPPVSESEFEDVMNRNRTVTSSAISRAITDAAVGDVKGASETILTAINLIRQSKIAHDERCRQLVYSLEDTLKDLEAKRYSSRSSKSSHRDRSRSRERDRKRRRRTRSRSRSYSRSPSPRRRRY